MYEVIKTEAKQGYVVRYIRVPKEEHGTPRDTIVFSAFTEDGYFIGSPEEAEFLIVEKGIKPTIRGPQDMGANVGFGLTCTIGFCEKEQKWYGWSHRAMYGFGIGDTAEEGDCVTVSGWTNEYLAEHPEGDLRLPVGFVAKTLDDAKRMAIAFADSVG